VKKIGEVGGDYLFINFINPDVVFAKRIIKHSNVELLVQIHLKEQLAPRKTHY
jgi:hypothetical protein